MHPTLTAQAILILVFSFSYAQPAPHSPCRFSSLYGMRDILTNSSSFLNDVFYWEGQFHNSQVAYNPQNGMSYDGCLLDQTTGLANLTERHPFSAASKEVL